MKGTVTLPYSSDQRDPTEGRRSHAQSGTGPGTPVPAQTALGGARSEETRLLFSVTSTVRQRGQAARRQFSDTLPNEHVSQRAEALGSRVGCRRRGAWSPKEGAPESRGHAGVGLSGTIGDNAGAEGRCAGTNYKPCRAERNV